MMQSIYLPQQKKGTIKEYKKLLYKKQYTHLKVLQLRYSGRDSIIQVRIDLIFIMVPLGEQKQEEVAQTYKTIYATHTMRISDIAISAWLIDFCHKAIEP